MGLPDVVKLKFGKGMHREDPEGEVDERRTRTNSSELRIRGVGRERVVSGGLAVSSSSPFTTALIFLLINFHSISSLHL